MSTNALHTDLNKTLRLVKNPQHHLFTLSENFLDSHRTPANKSFPPPHLRTNLMQGPCLTHATQSWPPRATGELSGRASLAAPRPKAWRSGPPAPRSRHHRRCPASSPFASGPVDARAATFLFRPPSSRPLASGPRPPSSPPGLDVGLRPRFLRPRASPSRPGAVPESAGGRGRRMSVHRNL